jgi:hypothetical protein
VKAALHEVMYAETRAQARRAISRLAEDYGPKYVTEVTTLEKDTDALLTFFDFPAEHWKHLRMSNVIESRFRDGTAPSACDEGRRLTHEGAPDGLQASRYGAGALAPGRRAHLVPLVRMGIRFSDGGATSGQGQRGRG